MKDIASIKCLDMHIHTAQYITGTDRYEWNYNYQSNLKNNIR